MHESIRSIYVHVPFCQTICGYCDFYSVLLDKSAVHPLVDALLAELEQAVQRYAPQPTTLFVGGGTPTTLPPAELQRLLTALRQLAPADDLEFTVEANPATVTPEIAAVLRACGVNRVSIGAQSFDPGELRVLDRIHRPEQVAATVEIVRAAGIENINLDLIFAIPGQSTQAWLANLAAAAALQPSHLSCYALTYERGTPLYDRLQAGQVHRADAGHEADLYEATIDALAARGYAQYEISNFAQPGRECRHNLACWHNEPYLGIGPSAAGFVDQVRYKNIPDAAAYGRCIREGRSPRLEQEPRTLDQSARETAMLELRLNAGLRRGRFRERFGVDPVEYFRAAVARHVELGLIEIGEDALRVTRSGRLVADSVVADFL